VPQPITPRAQVRQAAVAALNAAVIAQNFTATILSPGDWNIPPEKLPAVLVRAPTDQKTSGAKTQPNFTVNVTLEIKAFTDGASTAEDAQDAIEQLDAWIEQTLFTDYALNKLVQQVASVETTTTITADGSMHQAGVEKTIIFETFEDFEPTIAATLQEITLTQTGGPRDGEKLLDIVLPS
jgi:hypothetical protein